MFGSNQAGIFTKSQARPASFTRSPYRSQFVPEKVSLSPRTVDTFGDSGAAGAIGRRVDVVWCLRRNVSSKTTGLLPLSWFLTTLAHATPTVTGISVTNDPYTRASILTHSQLGITFTYSGWPPGVLRIRYFTEPKVNAPVPAIRIYVHVYSHHQHPEYGHDECQWLASEHIVSCNCMLVRLYPTEPRPRALSRAGIWKS